MLGRTNIRPVKNGLKGTELQDVFWGLWACPQCVTNQGDTGGHAVSGGPVRRGKMVTCWWRCSCCIWSSGEGLCWAVHSVLLGASGGLLTPLTFTRHRLSPLAVFTSGTYFLHNGRR